MSLVLAESTYDGISEKVWEYFADMLKMDVFALKEWAKSSSYTSSKFRQFFDESRRNIGDKSPLHNAAEDGADDLVAMIISNEKVDVNVIDESGYTALHYASWKGHVTIADMLLEVPGINPNMPSKLGFTQLHYAARGGDRSGAIVEKLLRLPEVDVNAITNKGETVLHIAAAYGHAKVFEKLLQLPELNSVEYNEVIGNAINKNGTVLHEAVRRGDSKFVERLMKCDGIKLTLEDKSGKTALDIAAENLHWDIFKMLRNTNEVTNYNEPHYKDRQASVDAANAILVGAALIASVTFAAWLQPPLGYSTDYEVEYTNPFPAPAVSYHPQYASMEHNTLLEYFWVFNSMSFFFAIATVISGARSVLPSHRLAIKQEVTKLRRNLLVTTILLVISMIFVLLAFAMAGVVVLPPVIKYRANIFSTIVIGGGVCCIFLCLLGKSIFQLCWDIFLETQIEQELHCKEKRVYSDLRRFKLKIRTILGIEEQNRIE